MSKIYPVGKISGYNMTLHDEVRSMKTSVEHVKELYGEIGVDIFEGRKPTILSVDEINESHKIINRLKAWWSGMHIFDYEQKDRLRDVILKYAYNKKSGKVADIKKMFGTEGLRELNVMARMGYINV